MIRKEKEEEGYSVLTCWTSTSSALSESLKESFSVAVEFWERNRVSIKENKETNMNQVEQKSGDETLVIIFIIIIKLEKGRKEIFCVMENLEKISSRKFLS